MYEDLDIKATKENVRKLLKQYNSLSRRSKYSRAVRKIRGAVNRCCELEAQIITKKYFSRYAPTDIALYIEMHMSESKFYRYLESALIQFAEAYNQGELLVYKE